MGVVEERDLRIPTFHRLTVRPQGYGLIPPHVSFHPQPSGGDQALAMSPDFEGEAGEEEDLSHQAGPRGILTSWLFGPSPPRPHPQSLWRGES